MVFQLTIKGYDADNSETDHLVKWVSCLAYGDLEHFINSKPWGSGVPIFRILAEMPQQITTVVPSPMECDVVLEGETITKGADNAKKWCAEYFKVIFSDKNFSDEYQKGLTDEDKVFMKSVMLIDEVEDPKKLFSTGIKLKSIIDTSKIKMRVPHIVIDVGGGVVQQVVSDQPVKVLLLDWDNIEEGDTDPAWEDVQSDYKRVLKLIDDPTEEIEKSGVGLTVVILYHALDHQLYLDKLKEITGADSIGVDHQGDTDDVKYEFFDDDAFETANKMKQRIDAAKLPFVVGMEIVN